jgi:hypothetical protein
VRDLPDDLPRCPDGFIEALMGIVKQYEINMGAQNKAKI